MIQYLISLFLPAPFLILLYVTMLTINPDKGIRFTPFFMSAITIIAYAYIPKGESDLYRYFQIIEASSTMSLSDAINWFGDGLIISNLFFWIAGKIGLCSLVPTISTAVVYGIALHIMHDFKKHTGRGNVLFITTYIVCMLHLFYIINNVRNICAFSIIIYAAYRDIIEKKRGFITYFLYVMPCFIHKTGFLIVAVRLLSILGTKFLPVYGLVSVFIPLGIRLAYAHIDQISASNNISKIIRHTIGSAYGYVFENSREWTEIVQKSISQRVSRIVWIFFLILVVFSECKAIRQASEPALKKYHSFVLMLGWISLVSAIVILDDGYWRFATATAIAYIPTVSCLVSGKQFKINVNSLFFFPLIGTMGMLLFLHIMYDRWLVRIVDLCVNASSMTVIHIILKLVLKIFDIWSLT